MIRAAPSTKGLHPLGPKPRVRMAPCTHAASVARRARAGACVVPRCRAGPSVCQRSGGVARPAPRKLVRESEPLGANPGVPAGFFEFQQRSVHRLAQFTASWKRDCIRLFLDQGTHDTDSIIPILHGISHQRHGIKQYRVDIPPFEQAVRRGNRVRLAQPSTVSDGSCAAGRPGDSRHRRRRQIGRASFGASRLHSLRS